MHRQADPNPDLLHGWMQTTGNHSTPFLHKPKKGSTGGRSTVRRTKRNELHVNKSLEVSTKGCGETRGEFLGKPTETYQRAGAAPGRAAREKLLSMAMWKLRCLRATVEFIQMLRSREFKEFAFPTLEDGTPLTLEWMRRAGFTQPTLIESKRGLGLTVPVRGFEV